MTEVTYASAGVDTQAGDRAVELMRDAVGRTFNSTVVGGFGGFAGMVDASALRDMRKPLLTTSTDGVGTKIAIAQQMDIHHTIGQDLVAMVVDDIAVVGARPLLMTDYIACGKVEPTRIANIVRGIAQACAQVDTPLLGGETAEHPGVMSEDDYDIAGAATGVVEADELLGADRVREGDVVVAMASSGLHSNGFSLVRRVIEVSGAKLDTLVADFGRTLGEELLEPTRLYSRDCLALKEQVGVGGLHALSHITGGGLGANLARVLPQHLAAQVRRDTWRVPPIFQWVQAAANVPWEDLESTLNMGVGMVVILSPEAAEIVLKKEDTWELGRICKKGTDLGGRTISGTKGVEGGTVHLVGGYQL
ncbi:MAG: phosphoribosylformylglycinamidine cyclo-ligase [Actinomycetaceae bacterium]|nr:phosphoribosylformylglycinamidine cyclo-ligase [Actinomycetaceae bacterium]